MKIFIVTRENQADKKYGLGQSIQRIATELQDLGHKVVYFSKTECEPSHQKWHPRLVKWLSSLGILAGAFSERLIQGWMAAKAVHKSGASHVWFQDPWLCFGFHAYYFLHAKFTKPFKWGVSEHGLGSFTWAVTQDGIRLSDRAYRRLLRYEKRVLLKADWVWSPSETAMNALIRDLQLSQKPEHWQAIHYGNPALKNKKQLCLHAPKTPPQIMALGRIAPVKNYHLLIDAVYLLQEQYHIPAQLIILGDGDHNALLDYAIKKGVKYPLEIRVSDCIVNEFERADIYTSACHVESFGLANREAVSYGLPCVVSAGGATCEVLGSGAWLVPNQASDFAQAFHRLLTDSNLHLFWTTQALNASEQWPSWRAIAHHYEQSLHSL